MTVIQCKKNINYSSNYQNCDIVEDYHFDISMRYFISAAYHAYICYHTFTVLIQSNRWLVH